MRSTIQTLHHTLTLNKNASAANKFSVSDTVFGAANAMTSR
jgi:hypothetical protein